MKNQPNNINPNLWRRFLLKRGYNGIYSRYGLRVKVIHLSAGVLELIESPNSLFNIF